MGCTADGSITCSLMATFNIYKITDTVGTGTTNAPKGMWTMVGGD
jgi:hypothetical protein